MPSRHTAEVAVEPFLKTALSGDLAMSGCYKETRYKSEEEGRGGGNAFVCEGYGLYDGYGGLEE